MTNPKNMLRKRKVFTESREALQAERHRYRMVCWKFFQRAANKPAFVIEMAERMKSHGLYAASTYSKDIEISIIKRWYDEFGGTGEQFKGYEHWTAWTRKYKLDYDTMKAARRGLKIAG